MGNGTMDRVIFNVAAQTVLRILIASYFLAVALNIIPGTDLALLFSPILPQTFAAATAASMSDTFEEATRACTSPVAGSKTSTYSPELGATKAPSM